MEMKTKRVLIGIDGSVQSLNAASYASSMLPPDRTQITLFYVDTDIKDLYFDIEAKPDVSERGNNAYKNWHEKHEKNMNLRFEQIRELFLTKGFNPDNVKNLRRKISIGVARDIIEESRRDYDLMIIGKTGSSSITGIPIGSVTEKLLSSIYHIPLVVVAGRPETEKLLLGFDNSHGAVSAVKNLMPFVGAGKHITFCHVIRTRGLMELLGTGHYDFFPTISDWDEFPDVESRRISSQKKKIEKSMDKLTKWIINEGINKNDVSKSILEGYMSRAQGLVEKSRKEGYGTLVLGRRGHSAVLEFFMGRVVRKAVHICDTMAVWIMN